jgi:hypothetical protein
MSKLTSDNEALGGARVATECGGPATAGAATRPGEGVTIGRSPEGVTPRMAGPVARACIMHRVAPARRRWRHRRRETPK